MAADVYRDVVALTYSPSGLAIGGAGKIVDWLVVMSRLEAMPRCSHRVIAENRLHRWQLDRVAAVLVQFYRRARAVFISPEMYRTALWQSLAGYKGEALPQRSPYISGEMKTARARR